MTLPKAISDAIDHVSPVDAPTEAEIEAWRRKARSWRSGKGLPDHATTFRVLASDIDEAVALMRRAAAATPAPSALERLRERVRAVAEAEVAGDFVQDETTRHAFACVLRWIDEEREREAKR